MREHKRVEKKRESDKGTHCHILLVLRKLVLKFHFQYIKLHRIEMAEKTTARINCKESGTNRTLCRHLALLSSIRFLSCSLAFSLWLWHAVVRQTHAHTNHISNENHFRNAQRQAPSPNRFCIHTHTHAHIHIINVLYHWIHWCKFVLLHTQSCRST